jgi:hypothetical protein
LSLLFPAYPPAFDPISLGESNFGLLRGELSKRLASSERCAFEAASGHAWKTRHVLRCRVGTGGYVPMSAIRALPSASPKADDAFQGSSGRDVPAQVELIHFGLDGNILFLRIPAAWSRREAVVADRSGT